jgi:hypothetical protein
MAQVNLSLCPARRRNQHLMQVLAKSARRLNWNEEPLHILLHALHTAAFYLRRRRHTE